MNVGITCYPTYGGSGIVATELSQCLAQRGHRVHIISSSMPSRLLELGERIFFHEVEAMAYPLFEYVPYDLALATKMVEVIKREDLDLLHVHYAIPHAISGYLAREMIHPRWVPVITTLHGTDITLVGRDHSYLPVTQFGLRQSDGVTAVSHFLKEATLEEFCSECDIRVIPNFVDVDRMQRRFSPEIHRRFAPRGEKILVHLSNFRPVKRVDDVVRVFHRVRQQIPAVLLMIGDGVERSNAQYLASELGIGDSVFFVGMVDAIENYLSVCDVMLLPSETESFGLAALEAMACGVPVVATRVGGVPELIQDGETGLLHPVGDVAGMAQAAVSLLAEDRLRQLRINCRERSLEYSAQHVAPLYEAYYRETIEKGVRSARGSRKAGTISAIR